MVGWFCRLGESGTTCRLASWSGRKTPNTMAAIQTVLRENDTWTDMWGEVPTLCTLQFMVVGSLTKQAMYKLSIKHYLPFNLSVFCVFYFLK